MAESEMALQAFDYTVLPANMCTVIRANTEEFTLHMNRSVQEYGQACVNVMNVHAALADRYSGRWAQWCQSVGLSIRSATRMVEVGSNVMGSAKLAELVQDGQIGKSLLQAICAPSAEPEAVEQVLSGDITTHKEYQEALKQLKEKDAQLKLSNKRIDELQAHSAKLTCDCNDEFVKRRRAESKLDETRTRLKSACIQEQKSREAMQAAENARDAALADVQGLSEQNNKLKDENAALKKQPITAVVDEEEMDKRAHQQAYAIAADMTGELRQKLERMQENDAAWVFQSKDRMESEWERMVPILERMEPDIKKAALDGVLKMLGRIQGQAFALYPAEEEAGHEVPGTY